MIKKTQIFLLAQRTTDGKFLRLHEERHTTGYDYVAFPELAKRISVSNKTHIDEPNPAHYYFEYSYRARELWLKDCVMVPYKITITTTAEKL